MASTVSIVRLRPEPVAVLHYLGPAIIGLYYFLTVAIAACTLQKSQKNPSTARRRKFALWILLGVIVAFIGECTLYAPFAISQVQNPVPQHFMYKIYLLSSALVWTCVLVSILETQDPVWHACLGAWSIGAFLDVALLAISLSSRYTPTISNPLLLPVGISRIALELLLVLVGLFAVFSSAKAEARDEENEPLIGSLDHIATSTSDLGSQYGSLPPSFNKDDDSDSDSDETDDSDDEEFSERQRKRIQQQGGLWNYLKGFSIFLPHIWPSNNRTMQMWLGVMLICICVERALTLLIPRQLGIITDALTGAHGQGYFPIKELLVWSCLHILQTAVGVELLKSMATNRIGAYTRQQLTSMAFNHVMGLSMDYHTSKSSGELLKAIEQGTDLGSLIDTVVFGAGPMLVDLIVAATYLSSVFDAYMALIIATTSIAYIYIGLRGNNFAISHKREYNEASRKENEVLYDAVSNWQTVAYNNRRAHEQDRYLAAVKRNTKAEVRYWDISQCIDTTQDVVMALGLLSAATLAAYRIASGTSAVGNFVMLLTYWNEIESPLGHLTWTYRHTSSVLVSAERLLQVLLTEPTVRDPPDAEPLRPGPGRVDFAGVSFAYDARKPVLKDVAFTAHPGQTVALVGQTGGGKSTLLKLLFRFYDATAGAVLIDGQDVRGVALASLRDAFGVVPQDPSLFNRTIMENLRYAAPGAAATDADVHAACRLAAIHDKILSFPDGYGSRVGERGVRLSGGELQRIAIARVFLKDPRLVLLDEATSAVDSSTEAQIQGAFARLSRGRTTFVIAHRLSTVVNADLILVVENGEIVERGTHAELLGRKGRYWRLWSKQTSEDSGGGLIDYEE